jgi:hypothetical protein
MLFYPIISISMQGRFKMEYRLLFTIVRYNYRDYNITTINIHDIHDASVYNYNYNYNGTTTTYYMTCKYITSCMVVTS